MANLLALIDADIVAYKFASKGQQVFKWDEETTSVFHDDPKDVASQIDDYLGEVKDKLKADRSVVCLSCPSEDNWRLSILPTYKGNRKGKDKPLLLVAMRQHLEDNHECIMADTLEADDILGILATSDKKFRSYKKVMVSEDKDLRQIPALLFNPAKDEKPKLLDSWACMEWHMTQVLTGDRVDNYFGCPGVGPVKAERILENCSSFIEMWQRVVETYESKDLTEADALVQAQVSRILQASDYNFDTRKVTPWQPPKLSTN